MLSRDIFFFQVQIIWEIILEISSSIIPKRNIPESSSEEEKVAAMGNWSSMWMDMLWESVKQPQNCPHRGVRELGCLLTYSHPALIFLFLASRHGMKDLSSPNQGWNSCPPLQKCRVLTTGPSGKPPSLIFGGCSWPKQESSVFAVSCHQECTGMVRPKWTRRDRTPLCIP